MGEGIAEWWNMAAAPIGDWLPTTLLVLIFVTLLICVRQFSKVARQLSTQQNSIGKVATDVGRLKVLQGTGRLSEIELEVLLEVTLQPRLLWQRQVQVIPDTNQKVDIAVQVPGIMGSTGAPLWLPIDSKDRTKVYNDLQDARDSGDDAKVQKLSAKLKGQMKSAAKGIVKYIDERYTTGFAVIYLSNEGLLLEVHRIPNLMVEIQRCDKKVIIAGPSTMSIILQLLRTSLAPIRDMQNRSDEMRRKLRQVFEEASKIIDVPELQQNSPPLDSKTRGEGEHADEEE